MSTLDDSTYALVADLLAVEGHMRYMKDWDHELVAQLAARDADRQADPLTFRQGTDVYVLRRQRIAAGKTRRFDYTRLARSRPELYRQYVTETPPAAPVRLTFRARGRVTDISRTWSDLRSKGWVAADEAWGAKRREQRPYTSARDYAQRLFDVRARHRSLDEKRTGLRTELAALLVPDMAVLASAEHGDGLIVPALNPPKRTIDLDMAQRHATLRQFLSENARKESERWVFQTAYEAFGDDDEGDAWAD